MSKPSIAIIGAGLGGSTLGRCLAVKGISTVIYEKAPASRRYNYAITLQPSVYTRLATNIGVDLPSFVQKTRVKWPPSTDNKPDQSSHPDAEPDGQPLRVHRQRLEDLIREPLDIRWESPVKSIDLSSSSSGPVLRLEDGQSIRHSHIICADGVHSAARKSLLPQQELVVLPYVAINGKRRVSSAVFQELYAPVFEDSSVIKHRTDDALLQLDVFDHRQDSVSVNWTYSRKPRGPDDPVHKPNRPNAAATDIPEEFFAELEALRLPQPFSDIFDAEKLRGERLLSWLMRTSEVPLTDIQALARSGACFIGDAVHAEPILGGNGGNASITDAMQLAEWVESRGTGSLADWYEETYPRWKTGIAASKANIEEMHSGQRSVL